MIKKLFQIKKEEFVNKNNSKAKYRVNSDFPMTTGFDLKSDEKALQRILNVSTPQLTILPNLRNFDDKLIFFLNTKELNLI